MKNFKILLKNNSQLMRGTAFMYNLLHYNNSWKCKTQNNFILKSCFLKRCRFDVKRGKNNTIMIGSKARLRNCKFTMIGNNCNIIIGGGSTIISNVHFWCQNDHSSIYIGSDFTMEGGHIAATGGEYISIGDDCMFSEDVEIRNGDSHAIIDVLSQKRINYEKPVTIGDHVWITAHVRILKGVTIPSNTIIGNSSLVTSSLEKENAIYSGIPAKLIKENINWTREK
jgi:acetyltransferase-like isoleucine patch superfamily enzyme